MEFNYKKNDTVLGLSNSLENILKSRGVDNPNMFLHLTKDVIEDYNKFDNMELAGEILLEHIEKESKIALIPDFDLDGFSSGAFAYLYIKEICKILNKPFKVEYLIHSKKTHGLSDEAMKKLEIGRYDLLLIPDASSNDFKQHKILHDNNMDIIVLDHHITYKYSEYACVVNNQLSNNIKNKAMTGVGIVYKFAKYLDDRLNIDLADEYLDLLAIGMVADSCDMRELESRYLVLKGLKQIEDKVNKNYFLSAIFKEKAYSMSNTVTISGVAFYMSPTVNCIIRGGDYETKVNLFKAFIGEPDRFTDKIRGKGEVEMCVEDYMIRIYKKLKKKQDDTVKKSVALLSEQIENFNLNKSEILIVNGSEIEDNTYNRIVVNKITNIYHKHAMILSPVKNDLSGSATGMRNKEITDFRKWCEDTKLFKYALGHPMAFGASIPSKDINKLYTLVNSMASSDILTYEVDGIFNDKTLNVSTIKNVGSFDHVWGNKLDEPIFAIENILLNKEDVTIIGKNKTTIKFKYHGIEFIKFNSSEEEFNAINENANNKFTIIGKFKVNNYKGVITPQILMENYKYEPTTETKKFTF